MRRLWIIVLLTTTMVTLQSSPNQPPPSVGATLIVRSDMANGVAEVGTVFPVTFGVNVEGGDLKRSQVLKCNIKPRVTRFIAQDGRGYQVTETVADCGNGIKLHLERILFVPE